MSKFNYRLKGADYPKEIVEVSLEAYDGGIRFCVGDYYVATLLSDGVLELADLDGCDPVEIKTTKNFIKTVKE